MVAFEYMGGVDLNRRARRREKVQELALFILQGEKSGCSGHTLAVLITRASRHNVDSAILGMLLKPLVDRGNITRSLNAHGHVVYHIVKAS